MKKTVKNIMDMKGKEKISVLTCYDYSFAKAMNDEVDILLVGDSMGNVVYGHDSTRNVTMEEMIAHTQAVRNGAPNSFIVADMPYLSDKSAGEAVMNAKLLLDAGADCVKVEGKPEIVRVLVNEGIDVMGHIGHLPQTATKASVHREWNKLFEEAKSLEVAGSFCIVLEMVQTDIAKQISDSLTVPTIGIGAGAECDGQVLVSYDMLGLFADFKPKFVKKYLNLKEEVKQAIKQYSKEVKEKRFPSGSESFN
jgi:3-methyl-2-oxobutanoate hydroxymethyltransferase